MQYQGQRQFQSGFDKKDPGMAPAAMHTSRIWGSLDPFFEGEPVMGRKVANAGFLEALLAADPFDAYHFFLSSARDRDAHRALLEERYPALAGRDKFKFLTRLDLPRCLSDTEYAVFHLSDCIVSQANLAAARNALSPTIFPITAPIHSLSYANFAREFLQHLWPGTTPRDAIVATSSAGLAVVEGFFEGLRRGYGLSPEGFAAPTLARIPLGVDPAGYGPLVGPARLEARARLGLPAEAVVLLVLGRISFFSKMDLLPLLRALQRLMAAGADPESLCLAVAGWTDDDPGPLPRTLTNLAANIGLPFRLIPRPSEADKRTLFGVADVFVSLVDNPQETFGLTLLEAMASGLPVVASDFDGYRDLVEHGRTGYLISTLGLADTDPWDVLAPLCYDNQTHLLLSQGLAVDTAETAEALRRLLVDTGLRRDMGLAGRARVMAGFTWDLVVTRHLALWDELARRPIPDRATLGRLRHPAAMAYGSLFAGYPSGRLDDTVRLTWSKTGQAVYHGRDFPVFYAGLEGAIRVPALRTLLFLARTPCPGATLAARLAAAVPELDVFAARFHVVFALKHDLLEKAGAV
jgi:glycosyltransferase involved in cell wall biosynthesis